MSGRGQRRRTRAPEVPVSSFADIAFQLIIFFILVTSLMKEKGFVTDVPSGDVTAKSTERNASVTVTSSGLQFNDRPLSIDGLRKELAKLKLWSKPSDDQKIVIMEAQGGVMYQQYYEVMSAIAQASGIVAIVKEDRLK